MTKQAIGLGSTPDDGTGDTIRAGGDKINDNFDEIYTLLGDGTTLTSGLSATTSVVTLAAPTITSVASFAAGSAIIGKIASPLLLSPEPFTKILYGALVLGGGFLGEAGAKSLANAVMGFFGRKDKGNETSDSKTDTNQGAVTTESNVNETQFQQNDKLYLGQFLGQFLR